jgi:Spy/CpxP family protein refolding chaperone
MKLAIAIAALLVLPLMAVAQTNATVAPQTNLPAMTAGITPPGFPGGFNPPGALFEQFWNDPKTASELNLTDAQRKKLQDAALNQRLSLIDGGADALKAFTRLSALMDADQLDDAAYKQQLNNLAAAAGALVQGLGEMAVAPRRVLTLEQWRKLQTLQKAKRAQVHAFPPPTVRPGTRPPSISVKP